MWTEHHEESKVDEGLKSNKKNNLIFYLHGEKTFFPSKDQMIRNDKCSYLLQRFETKHAASRNITVITCTYMYDPLTTGKIYDFTAGLNINRYV